MKMSHEKEEVLAALAFLDTFSDNQEYKKNITIFYDYFSDLIELVKEYEGQLAKSTDIMLKMVGANGNNREGRRKLQKISSKL